MKKITKLALATMGAALTFATASLYADEVSVTDKISSDIIHAKSKQFDENSSSDTKTKFAGIKNKTTFDYESDNVTANLEITYKLGQNDADKLSLSDASVEYFIEYRPLSILGIGFHEEGIPTAGSYLPVWDDNVEAGKFGSTGISLILTPIEGLRAVVSVPASNVFDSDFALHLGADYTFQDMFAIGVAARNIISDSARTLGVYASVTAVDGLFLNVGYAHYWSAMSGIDGDGVDEDLSGIFNVGGSNIITLGLGYELDAINLALDFAVTFDKDESDYDLLVKPYFEYGITSQMAVALTGVIMTDFSDGGKNFLFGVEPAFTYKITENTKLGLGVDLEFADGMYLAIPVYVKFNL